MPPPPCACLGVWAWAECVHRGSWNKLVQNLTLNHLNCVHKLSQKIRPFNFIFASRVCRHFQKLAGRIFHFTHQARQNLKKKMEFLVSISKNLNFYLKFQTHTDQCDRECRTQHQIQGKFEMICKLVQFQKKSQESFDRSRTHAQNFTVQSFVF